MGSEMCIRDSGMLIAKQFGKPVDRGFVCYTRSNYKVIEIPFTPRIRKQAEEIVSEVLDVTQLGYLPQATTVKSRCNDCCYRNICVK